MTLPQLISIMTKIYRMQLVPAHDSKEQYNLLIFYILYFNLTKKKKKITNTQKITLGVTLLPKCANKD